MPRQPHPEINFRLGRGRRRERTSASDLLATMRALGMTDDEIRAALTSEQDQPVQEQQNQEADHAD